MKPQIVPSSKSDAPVSWFLYQISLPLARLLWKFNFSANLVSFLSLISAFVAATLLVTGQALFLFCIFWILSIILDFCDGMVARLSNSSNKSSFDLDHFLDLVKFSFITLALGIYWNSNSITLVLMVSIQGIFIFQNMNAIPVRIRQHKGLSDSRIKKMRSKPFFRGLINSLSTFHAGQLLLIAFAPFASWLTITVYLYILTIGIVMTIRAILILRNQQKEQ